MIVLLGLKFLNIIRLNFLNHEYRLPDFKTGRHIFDATLFGIVFALGWTPCVGPILGSVLTYTASRAADPWTGALYLATYSLGVAFPLIILSLFVDHLLPVIQKAKEYIPIFEKTTGVPHGEAVSAGMVVASALSEKRGYLSKEEKERIEALLKKLQLPTRVQLDGKRVLEAVRKDKKREGEEINFVLLQGIGQAVVEKITMKELETVFGEMIL